MRDKAFKISEAELQIGLQVAGVALIRFDYSSGQATLSPEAAVMYGLPTDELTISRDRLHSTFHPDEYDELMKIIEQTLDPASEGWFARDHRVVWSTGEVRWLSVRKQVFFKKLGTNIQANSAILAAIDITERKRTEAALRASEQKFSAIFDQTFELLGIISPDGTVQQINQSALNSIAAQREMLIGQKFWDTPWWSHSPVAQEKLRGSVERAAKGEFICYEVFFPAGDGSTMVTDFSLKPVFDELGRVNMLIAEGHNITERKRTAMALAESEANFRTLADNISQLAWMADAAGLIFWYNKRWFDYTGSTLAEMQGWGWQQVHHPEHLDRVVAKFRHCIEAGERWEDTFPLRGQDGRFRWFLSRSFPIKNETGKIFRWFGTNTDVTDLKYAQAALEERNRELDSFVHVISHDLKAPLRAISNLSLWIEEDLEGTMTSDTQQQMALLRQRVQRMSAMIDGLLNYARVGIVDNEIETVAVRELLLEIIDTLVPPPTFRISIASDLPIIQTKRLLLFQVFMNLISNAIKHHDRQDGTIEITVADQGDFYQFSVADDGPGISDEYQSGIFTIFRTGERNQSIDSTGIGLSIVKKIIQGENGSIHLHSEVGQGATFWFTWPK